MVECVQNLLLCACLLYAFLLPVPILGLVFFGLLSGGRNVVSFFLDMFQDSAPDSKVLKGLEIYTQYLTCPSMSLQLKKFFFHDAHLGGGFVDSCFNFGIFC